MLQTQRYTLSRQPPQVTVRFGDGAHSFSLRQGATLTELANRIGVLGAQHDGAPISIDIEFKTHGTSSRAQPHPRFPLTH